MAYRVFYAGTSSSFTSSNKLPSPVSCKVSREIIWSENTGRSQKDGQKAEMVGDAVANKRTFDIKWGILDNDELTKIINLMPKGFFYFAYGLSTDSSPPSNPSKYYRSEISYDTIQAGGSVRYKDCQVSVIEK